MKYIIGSGWWCSDKNSNENIAVDQKRVLHGDDAIRGQAFHELWYQSIVDNASPDKIIITDSCSPLKPTNLQDKPLIEFVSINENPGHSTNHTGKYSGWMRSVLMGLSYAVNCDCDYFVYVEQDVLLKGKGIIESEIQKMKKNMMFGKEKGLVQPLQQSFFILHRSHFERFLSRVYGIAAKDVKISPERKFAIASSWLLSALPECLFWQPNLNNVAAKVIHRIQTAILKLLGGYDTTKCGYGRSRPINFDDDYYYFQHGSQEELKSYFSVIKHND
ncbi:hypothetical protein [Thalassotalea euphylliae]|uniref:Uncharacterized protein n=1 Tax=Thalassotalea euphylliae TaxID=1655234 RepID=A0A3E0U0F5_9GAMM|nr:hypothetical protein [Thalassotalea euphylliae]REL30214.1 hypothetical protein DXX94_05560 [Thalassotalea euphylliae]